MKAKKHILVVGAGSVGKRHMKNLVSLGADVSAVDPRNDRLVEAAEEITLQSSFETINKALKSGEKFDGVVVGSPTKYHVEQCEAVIKAGVSVLLEKPVSITLKEAEHLKKVLEKNPKSKLLLGYTYRWWPPLLEFKKLIKSKKVGKIRYIEFMMGAHLADWHPWEKYQEFFMSSKKLGGGALLDESHFIDLLIWMFGMPKSLFARVDKISSLEIETDDNVDILIEYNDGLRANIHLDLYRRPHERYIRAIGDDGSIEWSIEPNCVKIGTKEGQVWKTNNFSSSRNDMFVNVAKEFLAIIDGSLDPSCTIDDGVKVMKLIEASRESSKKDKIIKIVK